MKHIFLLAMISAVVLSGCATKLTGGVDVLNKRIAYIDWNEKDCWNPKNPASAKKCNLKVGAGMRIRFDSIAIPYGKVKVDQQTLPSSYTYTVPDVEGALTDGLALGRENAFFMTALLSMSKQVDDNKATVWQLMYGEDSDTYQSRVRAASVRYATDILKPFLESMLVAYEFVEETSTPINRTTAQHAKRVLCSADTLDYERKSQDPPSRSLHVMLPPGKDSKRTIVLGSDNWFYANPVGVIDEKNRSEFMKSGSNTTLARTNIELSIAVRFSSEEGVRYVSPCTTVADIERMFGVEIVGLWREQSNLAVKGGEGDATAGGLITLGWNDKSTVSSDGYYSIELRPGAIAAPGGKLVNGMELCGKNNPCTESILLAHGDLLLIGRRQHVLGSFWHQ